MMIGKYSNEEGYKYEDESYPRECEHIECLISDESKSIINPINTSNIEYCLKYKSNPEYSPMNLVENNQECEVDKGEKEHKSIIWSCGFFTNRNPILPLPSFSL